MSSPKSDAPKLVSIKTSNGHLIIELHSASIGQQEAPKIVEEVSAALAQHPGQGHYFVLDLSAVGMLASMGLGMCVDLRNRAADRGFRPILFGLNQYLDDLMRMMRVERLFNIAANRAELERLIGQ